MYQSVTGDVQSFLNSLAEDVQWQMPEMRNMARTGTSRTILQLGMIGITDITFIHVEDKDEYGGQKLAELIANARAKIIQLVAA